MQLIGLVAGIQQDEVAKAVAAERLKEFGPQFEGTTELSPHALSVAIAGLMMNFGTLAGIRDPASVASDNNSERG